MFSGIFIISIAVIIFALIRYHKIKKEICHAIYLFFGIMIGAIIFVPGLCWARYFGALFYVPVCAMIYLFMEYNKRNKTMYNVLAVVIAVLLGANMIPNIVFSDEILTDEYSVIERIIAENKKRQQGDEQMITQIKLMYVMFDNGYRWQEYSVRLFLNRTKFLNRGYRVGAAFIQETYRLLRDVGLLNHQSLNNQLQNEMFDLMANKMDKLPKLMQQALNYLHKFWKQVFAYRNDGEYSIDNLAAERAIRPQTIQRKGSLFFGSVQGALRSAMYNTFIQTCKQVGVSFRQYFKALLKAVKSGRTDYENLLPMTICLD